MKLLFLSSIIAISGSISALDVDDFLPPIQAKTADEKSALSRVSGNVKTATDDVTGGKVVVADNAQDAINHIVEQQVAGCEMVRFGSGFGWVATGAGSYQNLPNSTATRISKRNAYMRAFLEAKKNLAESLGGLSTKGKNMITEKFDSITDAKEDLSSFESNSSEQLEQSVQMLLKGFVIYKVEDVMEDNTVFVSIVTSPKTRGKFNRPDANSIESNDIRSGLKQVFTDIENGLIPPVGGKIIRVKSTGEMAFVGFGSCIVRTNKKAVMQRKLKLQAIKVSTMRASDALCGLIIGDDSRWKGKVDEQTRESISDFEEVKSENDVSLKKFAKAKEEFRNRLSSTEIFQSFRRGVLPPGIMKKHFMSKDKGESYAVAIYLPSVSKAAAATADDMRGTNLIDNQRGSSSNGGVEDSKDRPDSKVGRGVSGQISDDDEL